MHIVILLSFAIGLCMLVAGTITGHANEVSLWWTVCTLWGLPAGYGAGMARYKIEDGK